MRNATCGAGNSAPERRSVRHEANERGSLGIRTYGLVVRSGKAVLVSVLVFSGCDRAATDAAEPASSPSVASRPAVRVATVEAARHLVPSRALGSLVAPVHYTVKAEVPGEVRAVEVDVGHTVKAGDVLVRLSQDRRKLETRRARSTVAGARVELEQAKDELRRLEQLAGTVAEMELQRARGRLESAQASLSAAEAAKNLTVVDLRSGVVRAPGSGVVVDRLVDPGSQIQPGDPLVLIDGHAPLEALTWVSEHDAVGITEGDRATVSLPGSPAGSGFPAEVESVSREADGGTGNFWVRLVLLDTAPHLRPGLSVEVAFQVRTLAPVVSLPLRAVVDRRRRHVAYVVEDGVASPRPLALLAPIDDRVPVLAGLQAGERVVVEGADLLDGETLVEVLP